MAWEFVVVQPLSVQTPYFFRAGRWPRHQWFRRDNQFTGTATQRNSIFSGGCSGASAQTATAVSTCKIPILQYDRNGGLALGLWGSAAVDNRRRLAITGAAGPGEIMP
ncbi:hypothetical protein ACNKHP_01870 [Shigella boydii]